MGMFIKFDQETPEEKERSNTFNSGRNEGVKQGIRKFYEKLMKLSNIPIEYKELIYKTYGDLINDERQYIKVY